MIKQKEFMLTFALIGMIGCTAPIKTITSDKSKYLFDNFSISNLNTDVRERLAKIPPFEQNFKKIVIHFDNIVTGLDKKETVYQRVSTIHNLGKGYNQYVTELLSNNFKTSEQFQLVFGGKIIPLLTHFVYYKNDHVSEVNPNKVLNIDFNFDNPAENSNYLFEYEGSITGKYTIKCKSEKYYSASKVFNKIKGDAINLNCDQYINNIKSTTENFIFLKSFNVAIYIGGSYPNGTEMMKITDFNYE